MNRWLLGLQVSLVSLLLSSRPAFSQTVEIDLAAIHSEAVTRFRSGNYTQALTLYRRLADLQPDNMSAKKDLMWALWNAGQFEEAGQVANTILDEASAGCRSTECPETRPRYRQPRVDQAPPRTGRGELPGGRLSRGSIEYYQQLADLNPCGIP